MFDSPDEIERKIAKAVTDTDGEVSFDWDKKPGISNLLEIYAAFTDDSPEDIASRYSRYGDLKKDLAEVVIESLAPLRERYEELLRAPDEVEAVAARGALKAGEVAGPIYRRAATAMGLI